KSIEGKSLDGYSTHFSFEREAVRRGWWNYSREFGSPLNMKEYYKVTVPSKTTDGNVDLIIYTQTTSVKGGASFFLGVEGEEYKEQSKNLLIDFKKGFYIDQVLEKIDVKKDEAKNLSDEYEETVLEDRRVAILNEITAIKAEIEAYKSEIRAIEKQ
ncbi:MAG: hypothetical protein AAF391_09710, partial [Bacteroidota bacterium]